MKIKWFPLIAFTVPAVLTAFSAAMPANAFEKPEMSVEIDPGKPKYIHRNKLFPCSHGVNHGGGCTRVYFYAELHGTEMTWDGAFKKIKLRIGLRDVEVELSSDLKKKTCLFDAVLKHELTHLALHRRILKRFAPEIAKAVLSVAQEQEPPVTQAQFNRISNVLSNYVDRMMKEDEKQNALMDTTEAYRYQQEQCRNGR